MKGFRLLLALTIFVVPTFTLWGADQAAQDLYKSKCQGCHGPDGRATAIGKKLGAKDFQDPDVSKHSESDFVKSIEEGQNKMPAYKGKLTDDQIKALASYVKQLK